MRNQCEININLIFFRIFQLKMSNTGFSVLKKFDIQNINELSNQQIMYVFLLVVILIYMDFENIFLAVRPHKRYQSNQSSILYLILYLFLYA